MTEENKNAGLIAGLREFADFLEERQLLPGLNVQDLALACFSSKEEFRAAAALLGDFTAELDGRDIKVTRRVGTFRISFYIERSLVMDEIEVTSLERQFIDSLMKVSA